MKITHNINDIKSAQNVKCAKKQATQSFLHSSVFTFCLLICASLLFIACGKKEAPLPQKIDHLFTFQNVYVYQNQVGSLTVMGTVTGARNNVQGLKLEIEGYDESCPTCPFVPAESFAIDPRNMWNSNMPTEFSFTVMPTMTSSSYRWRLTGYNVINGLPEVRTPVLNVQSQ